MTNSFKQKKYTVFPGWSFSFIALLAILFFSSCKITRTNSYFRELTKDTVVTLAAKTNEELKVKQGDILTISVSSLSKEEDELFNNESSKVCEINAEGNIYFHRIGKLPVVGLTRRQVKLTIEEKLTPYLKEPIVSVKFVNHHVTILGDINNPRILEMPAEKISLIDAIAQSGSVNPTTKLSSVIIIRDSSTNMKQIKHVNLEDHSLFGSQFFYLQPNDVVVLNADEKLIIEEKKRQRYQQISTVILQAVTVALVIYQTFFRN